MRDSLAFFFELLLIVGGVALLAAPFYLAVLLRSILRELRALRKDAPGVCALRKG
jgi:hypothetical protein